MADNIQTTVRLSLWSSTLTLLLHYYLLPLLFSLRVLKGNKLSSAALVEQWCRKSSSKDLTVSKMALVKHKFRLNDGSSKFMEMNTLLEPANNAAAMQNDQDEIREVSTELSQIKKQHDDVKKLAIAKEDDLDKIKKEIDFLGVQEQTAEGPVFQVKSRLEQLEECLDTTKLKIDEETLAKYSYTYMLERMKRDHIATKISTSEFETSLKSKNSIMDVENQKSQRSKEERL